MIKWSTLYWAGFKPEEFISRNIIKIRLFFSYKHKRDRFSINQILKESLLQNKKRYIIYFVEIELTIDMGNDKYQGKYVHPIKTLLQIASAAPLLDNTLLQSSIEYL